MLIPDCATQKRNADHTLVKALARAFRWKRMLESGEFATIGDLARHEGITLSYMTRILQLTLLAPDIVDAILDGRQARALTLQTLRDMPDQDWQAQSLALATG